MQPGRNYSRQKLGILEAAACLIPYRLLGREYKSGDYQESFSDYVRAAIPLYVSRQPNLERDCKARLPSYVLSELRQQVLGKQPGS